MFCINNNVNDVLNKVKMFCINNNVNDVLNKLKMFCINNNVNDVLNKLKMYRATNVFVIDNAFYKNATFGEFIWLGCSCYN